MTSELVNDVLLPVYANLVGKLTVMWEFFEWLARPHRVYVFLSFICLSDQNTDTKHDNTSSPGISDQEKEMASSAHEAFTVLKYIYFF